MLRGLPDFPLQQLLDALVGGIASPTIPTSSNGSGQRPDGTAVCGTWRTFPDRALSAFEGRHLAYDGARASNLRQ